MRTFIIKPGDLIPIGRAGENQATQIRFDVTGWADTFGAGTYTLVVKRPHEDTAYPVEVATDGDYVVWTVSNVDTGIAGNASVQLRYVVDGALAKSVIYTGIVGESLDNIVYPPDPFEDLIQRMVDLTERTEAAATSAAGSAASATEAAGTATTAKTAAEAANTAAQSAKTAAQAANTDAQSAKTAAQSAKNAAEAAQSAAASSATAASGSATAAAGSATQAAASATAADASATAAAQSAADAQAAAMDVIDKAPIITDTASGTIASFPDGADEPIKQLTVEIEPQQDLHGYDNPWPAGGGKNLFDIDSTPSSTSVTNNGDGSITVTTNSSSTGVVWHNKTLSQLVPALVAGETYYLNATSTGSAKYIYCSVKWDFGTAKEVTQAMLDAVVYFYASGTSTSATIKDIIFCKNSETDKSFAPYKNICPITGWTGADVVVHGANALDIANVSIAKPSWYSGSWLGTTKNSKAGITQEKGYSNGGAGGIATKLKRGATYTISWTYDKVLASSCMIYISSNNGTKTTTVAPNVYVSSNTNRFKYTFTVPSDSNELAIRPTINGTTQSGQTYDLDYIKIEFGSTATDFSPYAGTSYPITWQSEAGTVYGGTLTVEQDGTGTLVATHSLFTVTSFAGVWGATSNGYAVYATISGTFRTNAARSNWFKYNGNGYTTMPAWTFCGGSGAQGTVSFILPSTITSKAEANAWLASLDTPLTVYIKLATPVTYTMTAQQMRTLLGQNNWWADTGDVSVNYRADTKLYIDKKLAALLAALS